MAQHAEHHAISPARVLVSPDTVAMDSKLRFCILGASQKPRDRGLLVVESNMSISTNYLVQVIQHRVCGSAIRNRFQGREMHTATTEQM